MRKLFCMALLIVCIFSISTSAYAIKLVENPQDVVTDMAVAEEPVDLNDGLPHIQETVILDQGGIKITAKKLESSLWGQEIKLLIENNSSRDITVQARDSSINGYMVETMMSSDVQAGKKINDSLTFMDTDFEAMGISIIADLTFSLHIFDESSWDTIYDSPLIQLKTNFYDQYEYVFDDSGIPVYDSNGIQIVVKDFKEDELFGPELILYVSNSSGRKICVQARDASINGFMVDPSMSIEVPDGYHAVDDMMFFSSELEENGITSCDLLEFSLHIFDDDSWDTIADTAPITLDLTE